LNIFTTGTYTVNLDGGVAGIGGHTIKVYTWEPESPGGLGDTNKSNDTLSLNFSVTGSTSAPLSESFTTATFPPQDWAVVNGDNNVTWTRNINGRGNVGSAMVNTFNYTGSGQQDTLATPTVSYSGVDSVTLTFDVASASAANDELEIRVTADCGNTFQTVYKKSGANLRTVSTQTGEFIPTANGQWRNERVDLTAFLNQSPIQVRFITKNNKENNIFIDNVNITTRTLPDILKQQGYLVLPTIFRDGFTLWHYLQPTTLKFVNVYNAAGQLIWASNYNGDASRYIQVDMSGPKQPVCTLSNSAIPITK
jgi:hypothetical protein